MAIVAIHDTSGHELIKGPVLVYEASWIRNKPGRLVFRLPIDHPMCKDYFIRYGMRVTAKFEGVNHLWSGFIDPPRKWGDGGVWVYCRSMEYLFHYRRYRYVTADKVSNAPYVIHGTSGELFKTILDIANAKYPTGIQTGSIWYGGSERQETLNDIFDTLLADIAGRSGCVWDVTSDSNDGLLVSYLNYKQDLAEIVDYALEEGLNLETPSSDQFLVEDGDVFNDVLGLGDGDVSAQLPAYAAVDKGAIVLNDLRQTIEMFPGNVEVATVQRNAEEYLAQHVRTQFLCNPVLPYTPEIASKLRVGVWMPFKLKSAGFKLDGSIGFNGYAPIYSFTINEANMKISLTVAGEEVNNVPSS